MRKHRHIVKTWICRLAVLAASSGHACSGIAQTGLCGGNLGDNIFTSGTFGSDAPNVLQMNPGYAPGFQFITNVPPDDGEYCITNDMRQWGYVFPAWLRIGDNDIDPEGYMMVVNASFAPGVFYEQIIDNLCENTRYEFSADIINIVRNGVTGHILPNVTFLIDDVLSYTTGQIPQDEQWHTYGFTFITAPGQFSVKLTLRNNAPGGTGNDLALDNISFKPCGPASLISVEPEGRICENMLFPLLTAHIDADTGVVQWQISVDGGMLWEDIPGAIDRTLQLQQLGTGNYFFRYLYSNTFSSLDNPKCRIASDILQVQVVPVEFIITDTICEGMTVTIGNAAYTTTGIYEQLFTAANGCDSLVILDLTVVPDPPVIADFATSPPSCAGGDDGAVFLVSVSGIRPPFTMIVDGEIVPPPSTLVYLPAGTYIARIETGFGCFDEDTVVVEDGPLFTVTATGDTLIRLGHSVQLFAQTSLQTSTLVWSPAAEVACPFCASTLATPLGDQTYIVEAVTENGCTASDSITVRVDNTIVLYVPNIFTPNQDNINDHFSIFIDPLQIISVNEVFIFDRWGGIISHKALLDTGHEVVLWDGNTRRGPAKTGVYVYLLKYTLAGGKVETRSGDVMVVR